MSKYNKKSKKITKLLVLTYIVFMFSIILTNGLSKYRTTYANKSTASIAKPIINVVTDTLTVENLHNEEYEWDFSVTNYNNENEINEVALAYKIQINMHDLANIEYKVYKISGQTKTELQLVDGTTQQEFQLTSESMQEDKYCLVIKTADGVTSKSLESNIEINISATQKI